MNTEQRFNEIKSLYDGGQYEKALPLLQALANEGYAPAQHELAELYFHGWGGLKEDHAKAAEWYGKAAEGGHADSQYELGERYYNGEGVAQDREQAAKWYGKAVEYYSNAAEEGDINAQNMLATCLDYGKGIAQDHAKALEWWRKAAANGHYGANRRLEMLRPDEEKNRFQQAVSLYEWDHYDEALPMFEALAAEGHTGAMVYLGYCYAYGEGVEEDYAKCAEWHLKAAELGNTDAMIQMGNCYKHGEGVPQDAAKAAEWYGKAAEAGDIDAMAFIGSCYADGEGVEQDKAKAAWWYRKAAKQGDEYAQGLLDELEGISENSSMCERCRSGEEPIFCEVCTYPEGSNI